MGHVRYLFWIVFTLANLVVQVVFVVKFRLQVLTDTIAPNQYSWSIEAEGRPKTYNGWMEGVFNLSKTEIMDNSTTNNIHFDIFLHFIISFYVSL